MIYDILSKFYDALVFDEDAYEKWAKFTIQHMKQGSVLELASGNGEVASILHSKGIDIVASDLSKQMLGNLEKKHPDLKVECYDMKSFKTDKSYDNIICYGDSVNYLTSYDDLESMIKCAYETLSDDGVFMFDIHSIDRLNEFKEMYIEEDEIDNIKYQWTIISQDDQIHQHFAFYLPDRIAEETHLQKVFDLEKTKDILKKYHFDVDVYTDFDYHGIKDGEKYFVIGKVKK